MPDELIAVDEVAGALKLNPATIRNRIDAGTLPHTRVGRRIRIRQEDVDAVASGSAAEDLLSVADVAEILRLWGTPH
jgi:excisionase family DNA binding protein